MVAVAQNGYQLPDGLVAVELQANPFSNDFNMFKMGELKARLFLDNKNVVRIGVGIGIDSDKNEDVTSFDNRQADAKNYTLTNETKSTKTNETMLKLSAGYEYHFAHAGRMDFYAGAEAGYEGRYYSGTVTNNSESRNVSYGTETATTMNSSTEYKKMLPDKSKYNENSFFANIFTGLDFYVYKGLYIGTELGISFKTGKQKSGSYTEVSNGKTIAGTNTTSDWSENYSSDTGIRNHMDNLTKVVTTSVDNVVDHSATTTKLKIYVEPALRIGWIF